MKPITLATLNRRSVANGLVNADATATRAFDFSILAPEFVRSLEVYKAPTADLEEGGLAGTVNVRTQLYRGPAQSEPTL